jgi:cytochrome c nitrite reductase small subunit
LVAALVLGVLLGVGGFTFRYAKGASYFRTAPEACVNCHIMQPQYDGWSKASHHTVAVCVDCHLPQEFFTKYFVKAENGFRHGRLFTTQDFHEPIELGPTAEDILQANCRRCHAELVAHFATDGDLRCTHCHAKVGHGDRAGLGGPLRADEKEHPTPSKEHP